MDMYQQIKKDQEFLRPQLIAVTAERDEARRELAEAVTTIQAMLDSHGYEMAWINVQSWQDGLDSVIDLPANHKCPACRSARAFLAAQPEGGQESERWTNHDTR